MSYVNNLLIIALIKNIGWIPNIKIHLKIICLKTLDWGSGVLFFLYVAELLVRFLEMTCKRVHSNIVAVLQKVALMEIKLFLEKFSEIFEEVKSRTFFRFYINDSFTFIGLFQVVFCCLFYAKHYFYYIWRNTGTSSISTEWM